MASSSARQKAENRRRQAEFRQRHLKDDGASRERLNMLISFQAKRRLERLAFYSGVTQRAMLERLLAEADRALIKTLPGASWGAAE
jgi:hypothetical protein